MNRLIKLKHAWLFRCASMLAHACLWLAASASAAETAEVKQVAAPKRLQCAHVACNTCQKLDTSGTCPVCAALPDSPPLIAPAPSSGPEASIDYEQVGTLDWGHNNAAFKVTSACATHCVQGVEKLAFTGDVMPDGYTIVVRGMLKGPGCFKRQRSEQNIRRTIAHEYEHRRFYMALINEAKANTGKVFETLAACLAAREAWAAQLNRDFAAMHVRQEQHRDFFGEVKYAEGCSGTVSVEEAAGQYGPSP